MNQIQCGKAVYHDSLSDFLIVITRRKTIIMEGWKVCEYV